MLYIGIIFIEFLLLLLFSQRITQSLYLIFFRITHRHHISVYLVSIILFPGTVIHELAHLITAEVLRVKTGKLTLIPQVQREENRLEVKAGSVEVAKTDIVRRILIGIAPIIWGTAFLIIIIWVQNNFNSSPFYQDNKIIILTFVGYLLFSISNSMFSSKKDLEGTIFIVPILILLGIGIYVLGIRISLTPQLIATLITLCKNLGITLGIVLGINVLVTIATSGLMKLFKDSTNI